MKRTALTLFLITGLSISVLAQADPKAKAILVAVSKKYKSYDAIKTGFTLNLSNPQTGLNETQSGTLYVKSKTNKYKVILKDQELISDGKSQWTYLKNDKEVQLTAVDKNAEGLNPAKLFTIYEKGFKSLYTGETKTNGKTYQNIDLSPIDPKQPFFKIKLKIDKLSKQISSAVIYDKNGSHYTYAIKTFEANVKVADSVFAFDARKYPGVEVVDLR
ncbi:MAG: outer membrane lipoprotein carrier protein LolA [Flavobacterium sp.]|nr:outer membrane lipoprotein carrier protein LolA [Pedobacter sp.]